MWQSQLRILNIENIFIFIVNHAQPFGNRFALPQPQIVRVRVRVSVTRCRLGAALFAPWVVRTLPRLLSFSLSRSRHAFDSETRAAAVPVPAAAPAAADGDYFSGISKFLF